MKQYILLNSRLIIGVVMMMLTMRMRKFAFLVLLAMFGWSSGASAAPVEWTIASGGNGHFYEVVIDPLISWDDARQNARAIGVNWDLASVTSQPEQDFIEDLLPASPADRTHFWLGGRDTLTEGFWDWIDGDTFAYTNWWAGEPRNGTVGEDYMAMDYRLQGSEAAFTGWGWNDIVRQHSQTTGYVVEQSIDPPVVAGAVIITEDEGINVDFVATKLNFVGAGVEATDAGSGETLITIDGPGAANLNLIQTLPAQAQFHNLYATITDPASMQLGTGVQLASLGGSSPNVEPDHIIGWFYNKDGPGGTHQNKFEHSFHHRVETNYKHSTATLGDNIIEFNQDVSPPDNSCELSSPSPAFETKAGTGGVREPITFTSGGTAEIVAYDNISNVIEFRMDNNTEPGVSDTITITDGGATAACDGDPFTYLGDVNGYRPYIQNWSVLNGKTEFFFKTSNSAPNNVLRIAREGMAVNAPPGFTVGTGLQAYTADRNWSSPAFVARGHTNGTDGTGDPATYSPTGIRIDMDWRGTNWTWENSAALLISTPIGPLDNSSSMQTPMAIRIEDQRSFDTSSSAPAVRIDAQTCGGSACTNGWAGNFTMAGGEFNNGHIVLGGIGSSGLHLWQDKTINQMKMRPDRTPMAAFEGEPFVTGSGVTTHGPSIWSVSDANGAAEFDTGDKVCGYTGTPTLPGVGMDCQSVIRFGNSGTPAVDLSTDCITSITNGDTFIAMCY